MDKKGQILSEALVLGWRLFLIAMIIMFVIFVIGPVFASKQDVRPAEAVLLSESIVGCISHDSVISPDFSLENCLNDGDYYINASLSSFDSGLTKEKTTGESLELYCSLIEKGNEVKQQPPSCIRQKYYVLIDNGGKIEKGDLNLLIGIRKASENVR